MELKECLLLISGGKDSFLSACRLVEEGYKIYLITYDNGCGLDIENYKHVTKSLVSRYGDDKVVSLGHRCISGIWRSFFLPIFNMKPSEIVAEYGEIPFSQLNCLTCRTAMYVYSIMLCRKMDLKFIAEGARKDQLFAIEQEQMMNNYRNLLMMYGIDLLTPVYDITDNFQLENELLMSGFCSSTLEPQCLIGAPMDKPLDDDILEGVDNFYNNYMKSVIHDLILKYENRIEFGSTYVKKIISK